MICISFMTRNSFYLFAMIHLTLGGTWYVLYMTFLRSLTHLFNKAQSKVYMARQHALTSLAFPSSYSPQLIMRFKIIFFKLFLTSARKKAPNHYFYAKKKYYGLI